MTTIDASFDLNGASLSDWMENVVCPLSRTELEALTIRAILEHRRQTDEAEAAYEEFQEARRQLGQDSVALQQVYRDLTLRNGALIAIVEALTTRLGYVPAAPPRTNG